MYPNHNVNHMPKLTKIKTFLKTQRAGQSCVAIRKEEEKIDGQNKNKCKFRVQIFEVFTLLARIKFAT